MNVEKIAYLLKKKGKVLSYTTVTKLIEKLGFSFWGHKKKKTNLDIRVLDMLEKKIENMITPEFILSDNSFLFSSVGGGTSAFSL